MTAALSSLFIELQRKNGAPDTIRTCDLRLRRATLYPAELRVRFGNALLAESRAERKAQASMGAGAEVRDTKTSSRSGSSVAMSLMCRPAPRTAASTCSTLDWPVR